MKHLTSALLLILLLASMAHAADQPLSDPAEEARAVAISNELRCVVCQSQSINDSQAEMARDMRQLVRDKVHAGWSKEQVITFARARYGDFILLRPPFQANTWLLWLAPFAFLGLAGGLVFVFINDGAARQRPVGLKPLGVPRRRPAPAARTKLRGRRRKVR